MAKKILIAEDDEAQKRDLELLLQGWGFEVVAAANGGEALAAFVGRGPFCGVLTDGFMPEMDGVWPRKLE